MRSIGAFFRINPPTGRPSFLDLKAADIAIGVVICGKRRHPCGIEAVFRAVDGHERPFAAGLHQTITAAVCLIRKKDGLRKRQRLQLLFDKAAKHALQTDRGYEGGRRARPSQNIGDVVSAAANGEPLTFRMQVFLGTGKMIDADNDVHTG